MRLQKDLRLTFLLITAALAWVACDDPEKEAQPEQQLVKEAYIYAFPAVEHNKAIWSILEEFKAPTNHFIANTELFTHENTVVVSPNNDTYYSYAVCDIRYEPVIISIPLIENRYFSFQLCDIFTNCPEYIGTLATGDGPGNYMIVRSDWEGTTPAGIDKVIKIPATVVLVLARTQVFGPDDEQAGEIAKSYKTIPLSEFAGTTPPAGDTLAWPREIYDAKTGDTEGFFRMFNEMVQYQILNETDKALMKKFETIGLGAGKEFNQSKFDPEIWAIIEAGAAEAKAEIEAQTGSIGKTVNTWNYSPTNAGNWGTDYMTRAAAAWKYIYVNTPEEAVYLIVNTDSEGGILTGANNYSITFAKDQIPQVEFFWSLTMYNDKGFLVENQARRYNIKGNDDMLVYNEDGSLKLVIQKEKPEPFWENNWLPAPDGQFYMILRLYGPSEDAIEGKVVIPSINLNNI